MNSKELEIKTEIEDWKPLDVSVAGIISSNQKGLPTLSHVNETENSRDFFDISKSPIIKLEVEAKQEIKDEPMDEVFIEQNEDLVNVGTHSEITHVNEKENSKDFFGTSEGPIIKLEVEVKQEIKEEPTDEVDGVHVGSNNDVVKRASDISNICFDHENNISIKTEIKQEIKSEPFDEAHDGFNNDVIKRAEHCTI